MFPEFFQFFLFYYIAPTFEERDGIFVLFFFLDEIKFFN